MARPDLADFERGLCHPLLPDEPRGMARVDDRRVLNGMSRVPAPGSPWRDLPERYGPCPTVCNRFNRRAKAGVRGQLVETPAERPPDSRPFIDPSIWRAHRRTAAQNPWPAPVASADWVTTQAACTNLSGKSGRRPLPRWRAARPDPCKGAGREEPSCAGGFRNSDRLSGHLPFTTRGSSRPAE